MQQQRGHDLVAHHRVRYGVDRGQDHIRVTLEDLLHRSRSEVLPIDPQPVVVPAAEVEEVVGVPVGQVAGPVPAVLDPGRLGVGVAPVALEPGPSRFADHLADGLLGIEEAPVLVEYGPWALLAGVGVDDLGARHGPAQGPSGGIGRALHSGPALGRAVGILDGAGEPLGESSHIGLGRLVAEASPQGVLGVVGMLG